MDISELEGAALDYFVAKAELRKAGEETALKEDGRPYAPSADWSQGGPIIEREGINLVSPKAADDPPYWEAIGRERQHGCIGLTPLIAAMRCYVLSADA